MRFRRVLPSGQKRLLAAAAFAAALVAAPVARGAIVFGQVDTFNGGLAGWDEGASSPNPPTVAANGGPAGAGDPFLQNASSGTGGPGGRMVELNQDQWTGNYIAQHVTRIAFDVANFGQAPMAIRVSLERLATGTRYASTSALPLAVDGGLWHHMTFELTPSGLSSVVGPDSLATVLGDVGELRIVSATSAPNYIGDTVAAVLGVDNIRALRLQGDADFDGTVGPSDFNLLASNFGKVSGATWSQGDFNFDGKVGPEDFNLLASNFAKTDGGIGSAGQLTAAISTVPEPGTVSTVVIAGAVVALCRRRRVG